MCNDPVHKKNRENFIQEMYCVFWSNMSRSMEGIWKVLAPITVVGTIIAGVHKDILPAPIGITLAIIIILWAINITIDLNAWHRRNLFFSCKSERALLSKDDYGNLLPSNYKTPKKLWISFYKINLITFFTFLIIIIFYALFWKLPDSHCINEWVLPSTVLVIGLLLTFFNYRENEKSADGHFKELFKE